MLLSELIGKSVFVGEKMKGVCLGVGVSLKSFAVKYLLCTSDPSSVRASHDFVVPFSAIERIDRVISLSHLRAVRPQSCAKFFLATPVYSYDGAFLGSVSDLKIEHGVAVRLFTKRNSYPIAFIAACTDAVLLRKAQPYPIGERIPAASAFTESVVTKNVLRAAIAKGELIRLTLSLPPFDVKIDHTEYLADNFKSRENKSFTTRTSTAVSRSFSK